MGRILSGGSAAPLSDLGLEKSFPGEVMRATKKSRDAEDVPKSTIQADNLPSIHAFSTSVHILPPRERLPMLIYLAPLRNHGLHQSRTALTDVACLTQHLPLSPRRYTHSTHHHDDSILNTQRHRRHIPTNSQTFPVTLFDKIQTTPTVLQLFAWLNSPLQQIAFILRINAHGRLPTRTEARCRLA